MATLESKPEPLQRWENEGGHIILPNEGLASSLESVVYQETRTGSLRTDSRIFPTRIDLAVDKRKSLIALLNQQLADTFDLYSQTKQAHWNVKGMQFLQLHELFDTLAAQLEGYVDSIAERATALGGTALGTARLAVEASRLPEYPLEAVGCRQHLTALVERFAALAATTRLAIEAAEELHDAVTVDLFTEVGRGVDNSLWLLESHLQG